MKNLLVTGFEPFGGENTNASWRVVCALPDKIGEFNIIRREIPVVFGKAAEHVIREAESVGAEVILCIGQAAGRAEITPEYIGINIQNASIPDNAGNKPELVPVVPGGPDGIFTLLPVHRMAAAVSAEGIPCRVSYSAGTYVCNDTLYSLLEHYSGSIPVGFIHIPLLPEQSDGVKPSIELEKAEKALEIMIGSLNSDI